MRTTAMAGGLALLWFTVGCGSDGSGKDGGGGPDVVLGETEAVDGAGSPAVWQMLDKPFVVRDFAAGSGETLAVVGSLYEREFVFGGSTHPTLGGSDGLIGTANAVGQAGWSRSFGSADADEALAVAVRPSGNVVVGGFFRQSIDLGGGVLMDLRMQAGFSDPYFDFDTGALLVFELDTNGALLWSHVATSQSGEGAVSAIALADNGDVLIAGKASGDLDFGGGTTSGDGIFVAHLGPDGQYISANRFEGPSAHVHSIAVDTSGVVLAGAYEGALDLGGGPLPETGPDEDGFIAHIDSTGVLAWALRFGGQNDDRAEDVALASDGSAIVCGYFSRTLDLGAPVERENETGFASRVSTTGSVDWTRAFAGSGKSRAMSVITDGGGNVVVGGTYRDGVDLGGGELPSDTDDGFLTGMAGPDGMHLFSRRIARFNFGGLAHRESRLFVTGTCEGVCAIGGEIVAPDPDGRLVIAELSADPASHAARWTQPAELYVEGETYPISSAIALPGSAPENPSGMTLVLSAAEIDCSAKSQLPRSIATGEARRTDPELALLLTSAELDWHDVTSWLSHGGGGNGGSALVLVERISADEIDAYVEHHVESTGSSATASYVMGKVTFRRCF